MLITKIWFPLDMYVYFLKINVDNLVIWVSRTSKDETEEDGKLLLFQVKKLDSLVH